MKCIKKIIKKYRSYIADITAEERHLLIRTAYREGYKAAIKESQEIQEGINALVPKPIIRLEINEK